MSACRQVKGCYTPLNSPFGIQNCSPLDDKGDCMKIALMNDVVYRYALRDSSAVGGAERYQWLLARALAAHGWSVTVGVRDALQAGQRTTVEGVDFVGIGQGQILWAWYRFLLSEKPDWWYWQGADHLWGAAVVIARLAGVQTIYSAAFDLDVRPREALSRRCRWWPLYAWGLFRNDRIFVQHGGQFADLPRRLQSKACVLPGVVGEVETRKPHSDRERYIAWVGVLRQPKRADVLLEIAREASEMQFVVCGGPSNHRTEPGYGEQVVSRLRNTPNIEYLGQVAPDEALRIIGNAALLLSTSDGEGFPSVFLEAWSTGTPVVSLKIDPDRIIQRLGLGIVPGGIGAAVNAIDALLQSPGQREKIALRARRYIAKVHSETAVASLFERALTGPRAEHLQSSVSHDVAAL